MNLVLSRLTGLPLFDQNPFAFELSRIPLFDLCARLLSPIYGIGGFFDTVGFECSYYSSHSHDNIDS
jgi:hypothetical protein